MKMMIGGKKFKSKAKEKAKMTKKKKMGMEIIK